jgi:serine/threonine-protein kinase 24/25/MST4
MYSDPKLSSLLPTLQQSTPQKPKLVLAQNNPHLKSHRRRQSSILSSTSSMLNEPYMDLPGQDIPGMAHTKHVADALYGKWVEGLKNRWPVIS